MPVPTITPLPDGPSTSDPENFESQADALIVAVRDRIEEANEMAEYINELLAGAANVGNATTLNGRTWNSQTYVYVAMGMSHVAGRAPNPLHGDVAGYVFTRVYIWVRRAGVGSWEILDPADESQHVERAADTHGADAYIGYLFEKSYTQQEKLYIIQYGFGARGLAADADPDGDFSPSSTGEHYDLAVTNYLTPAFATAQLSSGFVALGFWLQLGERDSLTLVDAQAFYTNMVSLYTDLLTDVPEMAEFSWLVTKCGPDAAYTYGEWVRINQVLFCTVPYHKAVLIDTDFVARDVAPNDAHFSALGYNELAKFIFCAGTGKGGAGYAPNRPPIHGKDGYPILLTGGTTAPTTPVTGTVNYRMVGNKLSLNAVVPGGDTTGATGVMKLTGFPFKVQAGRHVLTTMTSSLPIAGKTLVGFFDGAGGGTSEIIFETSSDNAAIAQANISAGAGRLMNLSGTVFLLPQPIP